MNIRKLTIFSSVVTCVLILLCSITVNAATSDELALYDSMLKWTYGSNYDSPSSVPSSDNNVDVTTGSYVEDTVDLIIPGKNGFDLNIYRRFSSQGSSRTLRYVEYPFLTEAAKYIGYFYNVEIDGYTHSVLVAFQNEESAFAAKDSFKGIEVSLSNNYVMYKNIATSNGPLTYVRDRTRERGIITLQVMAGNRANSVDISQDAIKLGRGWYIPMPSMRFKYLYVYDNIKETPGEFIDIHGKVYRYNLERKKENDIDSCVSFNILNCAGKYTAGYVNPNNLDEYTTHEKGFLYNAYVKSSDGITYYFETTNNNTFNIKGISDKYGNTIVYEKTQDGYILTDTYGNRYECNTTGIYRLDGEIRKQLVKYEASIEGSSEDEYNEFVIDDNYILKISKLYKQNDDIENTDNVITYNMAYKLTAPDMIDSGTFLYGFYPEKIEYPSGAVKCVSYDRYNSYSKEGYIIYTNYVSESKDVYADKVMNHYTYSLTFPPEVQQRTYTKKRVSDNQITQYTGMKRKDIIGNTTETYEYNTNSVLLLSKSIRGVTTSYAYDSKGNVGIETTGKKVVNYIYDTQYYSLPLTKSYNMDDLIDVRIEYVLSDDHKHIVAEKAFEYGVLMSTTHYTYDENNNLASVILNKSDGEQVKKTYDTIYLPEGGMQVTETVHNIKDADGNALANIVTVTKTDMYGNIIYTKDGNGNENFMEYDLAGRLLKKITPDGKVQTIDYDIVNNTIVETTANGNKIKYEYDPFGLLTDVYLNTDGTWDIMESYTYDDMSRQTSFKQYVNDTDYFLLENTYDRSDRLIKEEIKNKNGKVLNGADYTYSKELDEDGYIKRTYNRKISLGIHSTESITVNYQGNVIESKRVTPDASIGINTYTYNYIGDRITWTDANGNTEYYDYDYAGNMVRITSRIGPSAYLTYDELGQLVTATNYEGYELGEGLTYTYYTYDNAGRLVKERLPYGHSSHSETKHYYDANGNLLMTKQQATDTEYDTVTYEYDELNRVILAYDGLSYTQYFHDQYGNIEYMAYGHTTPLSSIEDADSETAVTHYEYDKLNRLVKLTDPMGFTETYTYDKLGNMLTKTDKNGVVTTYTYDYAGNILSKTAGNSYVNYEYNECGNPLSITNETGVISYEYDYLEQVSNVRYDPTDINAKGFGKLALDSDNNGNLTFSVFEYDNGADGTNYIYSEYEYDELNRMTNACIEGEEVDYEYDNNSNLIKKTANGVSVNMSYTDSKQLGYMEKPYETDYDDENGMANGYYITHYPNGNISQIYDAYTDTNTTYTYDRQGRLTESSCEDGSGASYSYDTRGNLTSMYIVDKSGNTYDSVMTSDINNRLISKTTTLYGRLWFKSDYTYDNNGNCISELITSNELSAEGENEYVDIFQDYATIYEYDEFNRLTRHMGLLIDEEYTYYGNNLRMGIYDLEGNLTTQHIYDGQNVAVDVTRDGTYTYKRGLDLVSRSKEGGEEEYYYFDPHGSVRAIVSETGEILDKYEYSDYGEVIGEYYGDNPFKYCAEYQDYSVREPKIYLRNRYYQPSTGRFLTSDPAQDGMNWYMYCGGDPVNYVDPLGLAPSVMEAALMADHVYNHNWDEPINNRRIYDADGNYTGWRMIDMFTQGTSKIGVYVRGDGKDSLSTYTGPMEYVLSYKGTKPTSVEDWKNNAQQFIGEYSEHLVEGMVYTSWFVDSKKDYEITFTGHSKGGGEAAVNAEFWNKNAIVFNPSVPDITWALADDGYVKPYVVTNEILNYVLGEIPLGTTKYLKQQHNGWLPGTTTLDRINNHGMEAVIAGLIQGGY